jgi:molybdenum cofactor guanylyltransferase
MPATRPTAQQRPAAIVLAGGLSARMDGRDKSLLTLGERPLIAHVLGRLSVQTSSIAISANDEPERLAEFGRPVLPDTIAGRLGPLAGVLAGLVWAREIGAHSLVSVPTDSPFIPGDLVTRLSKAAAEAPGRPILATSGGRRHPVVGLWPTSLAGRLLDFLASSANHKVAAFADANGAAEVDFPMIARRSGVLDPFFNVNTPEDLAEAEAALRELRR